MFACFSCNYTSATNTKLLKHIRTLHSNSETFKCTGKCDRIYSSYNSFAKHCRLKHKDDNYDNTRTEPVVSFNSSSHVEWGNEIDSDDDDIFEEADNVFDTDKCDLDFKENVSEKCSEELENLNEAYFRHMKSDASKFFAALYNHNDITRKRIQDIIEHCLHFTNGDKMKFFENHLINRLKQLGESKENIREIKLMINGLKDPFEGLHSEYLRFKYFENSGNYIPPEHEKLGERDEFREENGVTVLDKVPVYASLISIHRVLTRFFELPQVFDKTLEYINSLYADNENISNFIQGEFWKEEKKKFGDKIVFPISIFFDDYETNNPLGSHAGLAKCGAVYISILCLPPEFQSKLENIFLLALFNSLDRKFFTNKIIFKRIIQELEILEKIGITIDHPTFGSVTIYFSLVLILGDNLGVHSVLGFSECFRCNYPCRFCLIHRDKINSIFREQSCILRNETNYQTGLEENNLSLTGIKEECTFHTSRLPNLHVTKNVAVDWMHDCPEGVFPRDLTKVLRYYIRVLKLFNVQDLNNRIKGFNYGPNDGRNKPPQIMESHINDGCLSMSASEMINLIMNLGMIIGDLVPEGDKHWQLIILMKDILQILSAKSYQRGMHELLNSLIIDYLTLLSELFPQSMTPKHHYLIHYARIMFLMGPLIYMSSMRCESKHQEGKVTTKVVKSRINVCHTIAVRQQLKLNYRFFCKLSSYAPYEKGPTKQVPINLIPFSECLNAFLPSNKTCKYVSVAKWIKYNGQFVKPLVVIMLPCESDPKFYVVRHCIFDESHEIILMTEKLLDVFYDEHCQAYKVFDKSNKIMKCLVWKKFRNGTVSHLKTVANGFQYIAKKWI